MAAMIKLGLRYASTSREHLQLVRQLGVDGGTLRWIRLPGRRSTAVTWTRRAFARCCGVSPSST